VPAISTQYDVIILGAGAAGLTCAFSAGQRGRRVLVLEKANKVGKKILMSGGGRCNFTNYQIDADNFISANPHFCKAALHRYTQWDFIAMVERHGIDYEERKHGQLFCQHSAKDVLAMLLKECELAGVQIRTHCEVGAITALAASESGHAQPDLPHDARQSGRYRIELAAGSADQAGPLSLSCESLVVATGALSIPSLGGSGMGYDVARQFSLPVTQRQAGLVPFMFSDVMKPICERLSGLSVAVEVSCNGRAFSENLLFTHRGISGPAMLQISNYWHPGDTLVVDLLPSIDAGQWLVEAKRDQGKILLKTLLNQKLPKALVAQLQALWWPQLAVTMLYGFSDKRLLGIGEQINRWCLKPSGTEGYRTAEVTLGGVDTTSISSKTMQAKDQAGLYFIGEVLDVTGHLGGFNFQWAWSSGYSAGLVV
jgi:predicted Rossmann fold flavoprotein